MKKLTSALLAVIMAFTTAVTVSADDTPVSGEQNVSAVDDAAPAESTDTAEEPEEPAAEPEAQGTEDDGVIAEDVDVYAPDDGYDDDTSHFTIEDGVLTKYTGNSQLVRVPDGVTTISAAAFADYKTDVMSSGGTTDRYGVMRIILPESVTTIENDAFSGYQKLTEIRMTNNVTEIGERAFFGSPRFSSIYITGVSDTVVTLPNKLTEIKASTFGGTAITNITIPDNIETIGENAFYGCASLTTLLFGQSPKLNTIATSAFYGCANLGNDSTTGGKLILPASVRNISENAFYGCAKLVEVSVPEGVLSVEPAVFYGCASLEKVSLPSTVNEIKKNAFYGCVKLASVTIPAAVKTIGEAAFAYCSSMTGVTFTAPSALTTLENSVFYACTSLEAIAFPDGVTSIGISLFNGCTALASVKLNDSLEYLSNSMFYGCSSIQTITLPTSLTEIREGAFYGCSGLLTITVPSKVTEIGSSAFYGCTSLVSANVPATVTALGMSAFAYCSSLKNFVFPTSAISVPANCFEACAALESVTLHNNITTIFPYAFSRTTSLTSITIPTSVAQIDQYAFGSSGLTSVDIPDNVTFVKNNAFSDCVALESVSGMKNVEDIGAYAFANCSSLKAITIPDKVTTIGEFAFSGCRDLFTVSLTDSVTDIGTHAFENCASLDRFAIPLNITVIKPYTFSGCTSLSSVTISERTEKIDDYAFYNCTTLPTITIPASVTTLGTYVFAGCTGLLSASLSDNIDTAGNYGFTGCTSLKSISLPSKLLNIPNYMFSGCSSLASVEFSSTLQNIYDSAFRSCSSLTSVSFPAGLKAIGPNAFRGSGLKQIYIPASTNDIGVYAFEGCQSLSSVSIPTNGSLQELKTAVFSGCGSLTNIVIPSVITIGESAFNGCSGLASVIISTNVTSIQKTAFYDCKNLERVIIPGSVTAIYQDVFTGCNNLKTIYFTGTKDQWDAIGKQGYINIPAGVEVITDHQFGSNDVISINVSKYPDLVDYPADVTVIDPTGGKLLVTLGTKDASGKYLTEEIDILPEMLTGTIYVNTYSVYVCVRYKGLTAYYLITTAGQTVKPPYDVPEDPIESDSNVAVKNGSGKITEFKDLDSAFADIKEKFLAGEIITGQEAFTIQVNKDTSLSKQNMTIPAFMKSLTINTKGDAAITLLGNAFQINSNTILNCNIKSSSPVKMDVNGGKTLYLEKATDAFSAVTGRTGSTLVIKDNITIDSLKGVQNLRILAGKTLTVKGAVSGVLNFSDGGTLKLADAKKSTKVAINNVEKGKIRLVSVNGVTASLTLGTVSGSLVISIVDSSDKLVNLPSGSIFAAPKSADLDAATNITFENDDKLRAFQYKKNIRAEYPDALTLNGENLPSMEAAINKMGILGGKDKSKYPDFEIVLQKDISISKAALPKNAKSITIKSKNGEQFTLSFTGTSSLKAECDLIFENVKLSSDKAMSIAATANLTLKNVALSNVTALSGKKTSVLTIGDVTGKPDIKGFDKMNVTGGFIGGKNIAVTDLVIASGAGITVPSGTNVKITSITGNDDGTSYIKLESGFTPLTINGDASGKIKIITDAGYKLRINDEKAVVIKAKKADLSVFDLSGAVTPKEGTDYVLTRKGANAYVKEAALEFNEKKFASLSDIFLIIESAKNADADYSIKLLTDLNTGAAIKMPKKDTYKSITIDGNNKKLTFTGGLTLTGNLILKGFQKLVSDKKGTEARYTIAAGAYDLTIEASDITGVSEIKGTGTITLTGVTKAADIKLPATAVVN